MSGLIATTDGSANTEDMPIEMPSVIDIKAADGESKT